jgi:hypothetical protein
LTKAKSSAIIDSMKNKDTHLILILISYLLIGLTLAGNIVHDKTLKLTQDSIETLLKIEIITEKQFSNLQDRVEYLEDKGERIIARVDY